MGKPDGGPAFPRAATRYSYDLVGMSLRDWFAGQALNGWLASTPEESTADAPLAAKVSYEYADAMLAERTTIRERP